MAATLITGASSGLGREMALQFAARGVDLALCARRVDLLEELRKEINAVHPDVDVKISALDVADHEFVREVFHRFAEHFGGLERVIANAGTGGGEPLGAGDGEVNRRTMTTNVMGMLAQVEAAMGIFRSQKRGHLVLVSSFAAVRGMRRSMTTYGASKAAVSYIGEGLRLERVPGVDVTTLCPGYIATAMTGGEGSNKPLLTDVETGASAMIRAIEAKKRVAYIPTWPWALLARVFPLLPGAIVRRLT